MWLNARHRNLNESPAMTKTLFGLFAWLMKRLEHSYKNILYGNPGASLCKVEGTVGVILMSYTKPGFPNIKTRVIVGRVKVVASSSVPIVSRIYRGCISHECWQTSIYGGAMDASGFSASDTCSVFSAIVALNEGENEHRGRFQCLTAKYEQVFF